MCGITGWYSPAKQVKQQILAAMTDQLAHRGPDATAIWVAADGQVGLGHRRLAIIDLQAASNQPLHDVSGEYSLVFNGEIYNYRELRAELQAAGMVFRTNGDSEVLLAAYRHWGVECLGRLHGMFAFVIWDARQQQLFAARDRFGKKPFFYSLLPQNAGGGMVFASEPQALLTHAAVNKNLSPQALLKYLTLGYSIGQQSLWQGIYRLPAAHALVMRGAAAPKIFEYWDYAAAFRQKKSTAELKTATTDLAEQIKTATAARLVADVPFGLFLSGGLDSNTVLANMVSLLGNQQIKTFSIGFAESDYDESTVAAASAKHYWTEHTTIRLDPRQLDLAKIMQRAGQEPLADVSFIPSYVLAQQTAQQVKMVLTGDGGDELFAGYPTYIAGYVQRHLRPLAPNFLWQFLAQQSQQLATSHQRMKLAYKLKQVLRGMTLDTPRAHVSWRMNMAESNWQQLLHPDLAKLYSWEAVYEEFAPYFAKVQDLHPLDQALYVDAKTWMVDSVLVKMDRATMSHGLEARSPLLDHRIAEFAASLPPSYKLHLGAGGFTTKWLMRQAQQQLLPDFILNQPKKGFSVPVATWFAGGMAQQVQDQLTDSSLKPYLNQPAVAQMMAEHISQKNNHSLPLYNLMIFANWLQQYH